MQHASRVQQGLINRDGNLVDQDPMAMIPPELERTYQVVVVPGEMGKKEIVPMREVKSTNIG